MTETAGAPCPQCGEPNPEARRRCWLCDAPFALAEPATAPGAWTWGRVAMIIFTIIAIGIGMLILLAVLLFVTCWAVLSTSH
jgi:hypothetical protein